jgi:hypothetical protein
MTVFLAILPGLWVTLTRGALWQGGERLLNLLGVGVLALLVIGIPLSWRRRRRFPEWALLPAGLLAWIAVYIGGYGLEQILFRLDLLGSEWQGAPVGMWLLQAILAIVLLVICLRGKRPPGAAWLVIGVMVLVNLAAAILYGLDRYHRVGSFKEGMQFFMVSGTGVVEGLFLVAVGLLAARRHELLALLVIVGGFGYMCLDSDYISGFRLNEWAGYGAYVLIMTAMYMMATPAATLRATTHPGRAMGVFIPVGIFMVARILVPHLVLPGTGMMPWGDMALSANVLLSLGLGWVLYGWVGEA